MGEMHYSGAGRQGYFTGIAWTFSGLPLDKTQMHDIFTYSYTIP